MPRYHLAVQFLSNERPFKGGHDAHRIEDDERAIEWARGMEEGLGPAYSVTLFKDGVHLQHRELEEA
jgi:hypothetical protein